MLTSEFCATHKYKTGDTVFTITSECPEDTADDILDALVRLIKRDVAGVDTERK